MKANETLSVELYDFPLLKFADSPYLNWLWTHQLVLPWWNFTYEVEHSLLALRAEAGGAIDHGFDLFFFRPRTKEFQYFLGTCLCRVFSVVPSGWFIFFGSCGLLQKTSNPPHFWASERFIPIFQFAADRKLLVTWCRIVHDHLTWPRRKRRWTLNKKYPPKKSWTES